MLFGHQADDDTTQMSQGQVTEPSDSIASGSLVSDAVVQSTAPPSATVDLATADTSQVLPTTPSLDNPLSDEPVVAPTTAAAPDLALPAINEPIEDAVLTTDTTDHSASSAPVDDLLTLKQQALSQLTPLVDHLEQTPVEKFRTTMMMLQSTDNQALIKNAYAAAQSIPDDKARAQALLDVVNEINYFTQQKNSKV